jgi:hypothetical protein
VTFQNPEHHHEAQREVRCCGEAAQEEEEGRDRRCDLAALAIRTQIRCRMACPSKRQAILFCGEGLFCENNPSARQLGAADGKLLVNP